MARERGFFDARTRAFMGLKLSSVQVKLQIDTGFNGDVLIGKVTAGKLGVVPVPGFIDLYPAGSGSPFRASIDGLLGTGVIHPCKLTLDYLNDVVEITN